MEIIIDKIGIWKADFHKGYTTRIVPSGVRYSDKTGIVKMSNEKMYRYAKNYKINRTEFVLFVRTFNDNKNEVETQLDSVAKKVTEQYAREICARATVEEFDYLNEFIKEGA